MSTKLFYASDVHGSERCFRKFVSVGKLYKEDAIILGGDLTGKMIVPMVEQSDGTFKSRFISTDWEMKTKKEIEEVEQRIRNLGYYPYYTNPKEMDELNANPTKVDKLFSRLMMESLERWLELAERHLKDTSIKCFIMPGNDDRPEIDGVFEKFEYVMNPEGKIVLIDDKHEMISTGYTNITPWKAPRDIPEEELTKKIESMTSQVKDMKNCIFNFHCPPINSSLDTAPMLDKDLRAVRGGGQALLTAAGSAAVRTAIEKHQPMLGLHGHIHESKGECKIGRTLCLNPGSEYTEGVLRGVEVIIDEKKGVKEYLAISG